MYYLPICIGSAMLKLEKGKCVDVITHAGLLEQLHRALVEIPLPQGDVCTSTSSTPSDEDGNNTSGPELRYNIPLELKKRYSFYYIGCIARILRNIFFFVLK